MKLKAKLTVLLGVVMAIGAAISALAVYLIVDGRLQSQSEQAITAFAAAALLLLLAWATARLAAKRTLRNVRECMNLAKELRAGHLNARIAIDARDEIGELASGLNAMAGSLEEERHSVAGTEHRYREIFENAMEGIFQVTEDGILLNANRALARLLGCSSPAEIIGRRGEDRWADPSRMAAFNEEMRARGSVSGYEVEFVRQDGTHRFGRLHATAARDAAGNLGIIQGYLVDTTDERRANEAREQAREAARLLAEARLQALRYQIDPHFLFNTLNSVDALARQAPEQIPALIRELARYLRFSLDIQDTRFVPLRLELEALESYLNIERVRFGANLEVNVECAPAMAGRVVPALSLQPLVENAIKHGMKSGTLPLRVRISAARYGEDLVLEVANTGRWAPPDPAPRARVGLDNLRKRLDILYPGRHALDIGDGDGWVRVTLTLPAGEEDETA